MAGAVGSAEVATLRARTDLDLETATIRIRPEASKSGQGREVPLGPMACAIFAGRTKLAGKLVFGSKSGGEKPFSGWSKAKKSLDAAVNISPWVLHDLRRTVATRLDEIGVSIPVIEDLLGHVSGARSGVIGVYNKADRKARVREAVERLEAHIAVVLTSTIPQRL